MMENKMYDVKNAWQLVSLHIKTQPTVCFNVSPLQRSVQISMSLLLLCVSLNVKVMHCAALPVAALQSRLSLWRGGVLAAKSHGACLPPAPFSCYHDFTFVAARLLPGDEFFFSLVALICLICLDLNTLSFFYSSPTCPPVHCKQQRGKCSVSQAGASVSSRHHRYLSVGF